MSQESVELVRRTYERLNEAYEKGDFLAVIEEVFDPEIVLRPAGVFPESAEMRGHAAVQQFLAAPAEAFKSFWIEAQQFIEAGDRVVVPVRFGGRAKHTGLETEYSFAHVWTLRRRKVLRIDMYASTSEAFEAVGLAK